MNKNIVLIGFMGTGKTSVGKLISEKLHLDFIDIDEEIKKRCSMNIGEIFQNYGEKFFRGMEEKVVKDLCTLKNSVISTGGGIVLNPNNMELLRENGITIWLRASVGKILSNLSTETSLINDRPLLKVENVKERIIQLLYEREAYYVKSCNYSVYIDGMTLKNVVDECVDLYCSLWENKLLSYV